MSLHRHINSASPSPPACGTPVSRESKARLYKKPYHLTPTTPNPRLGDPSVVRPPPRGTGNQVTRASCTEEWYAEEIEGCLVPSTQEEWCFGFTCGKAFWWQDCGHGNESRKFKKSRDKEESDVRGYLPQCNCILVHISSQLADSYNEEEANCRRCWIESLSVMGSLT